MSIVPAVKKSLSSFLVIADQLNQLDRLGVSYDDLHTEGEIDETNRAEILKFLQSTNDKWNKLIVKTAGRDSIKFNSVVPLANMQQQMSARFLELARQRSENDDSSDSNSDSNCDSNSDSNSEKSDVDNSDEVIQSSIQQHSVPEQVDVLPSAQVLGIDNTNSTVLDVSSSKGETDINSIADEICSLAIDIEEPLITDEAHQSNSSAPTPQADVVDQLTREYDNDNDDNSGALNTMKEVNTESTDYLTTSAISVVNTTITPVKLAVDTEASSSSKVATRIARPTNEIISIITYPQEIPSDDDYLPKQANLRKVSNTLHHRGSLHPPALDPFTSTNRDNRRKKHAAGSTLFQWN